MTNRAASFQAAPQIPPMHRFGGTVASNNEIAIHALGDAYLVEGSGTVQRLPNWPKGPPILLHMIGSPTFVNSSKLLLPGAQNFKFSTGDSAIAIPLGDGVWRVMIDRSDGAAPVNQAIASGRLTLSSGVAITTADFAGVSTIYFTPCGANTVPIFDGNNTRLRVFSELALVLDSNSGHTGYHVSGSVFDLFAVYDVTSSVMRLVSGPVWTSTTARGTGAGTTELELFEGRWTNKNDLATARFGTNSGDTLLVPVHQGTYLGSFQATANGQASDTQLNRLIYNVHVPAKRRLFVSEPTATWTYSVGTTWRPSNNNTANAVTVLAGLAGIVVDLNTAQTMYGSAAGQTVGAGIGVNSTSTPDTGSTLSATAGGANYYTPLRTPKTHAPALGITTYTMLELGTGSGTQTWLGNGLTFITGSVVM